LESPKANSARTPVAAVNHIALMTGDLDRLTDFYVHVFGAEVLARAEGHPRKCFLKLTSDTSMHVFEDPQSAAKPADHPFDEGSINHFALQASDPDAFITIRTKLIADRHATKTVYDAPGLYTIFATDPDGLLIEVLIPKQPDWTPPFATEPFAGLGEPATPTSPRALPRRSPAQPANAPAGRAEAIGGRRAHPGQPADPSTEVPDQSFASELGTAPRLSFTYAFRSSNEGAA
jgi:catechol 2,3-dioxygenase-like lactoylglutathione lyase family enzyme